MLIQHRACFECARHAPGAAQKVRPHAARQAEAGKHGLLDQIVFVIERTGATARGRRFLLARMAALLLMPPITGRLAGRVVGRQGSVAPRNGVQSSEGG